MTKVMMKWLTGIIVVLYILLVMFNVVPQMVSAPDTVTNVFGAVLFGVSIPAIIFIIKKVFK